MQGGQTSEAAEIGNIERQDVIDLVHVHGGG